MAPKEPVPACAAYVSFQNSCYEGRHIQTVVSSLDLHKETNVMKVSLLVLFYC